MKRLLYILTFIGSLLYSQEYCTDDDASVAAFGGCAGAVAALGCDFVFAGTPISEYCPESCDACLCADDDASVAAFGGCAGAVAFGCDFVFAGTPISEYCPESCGLCGDTNYCEGAFDDCGLCNGDYFNTDYNGPSSFGSQCDCTNQNQETDENGNIIGPVIQAVQIVLPFGYCSNNSCDINDVFQSEFSSIDFNASYTPLVQTENAYSDYYSSIGFYPAQRKNHL